MYREFRYTLYLETINASEEAEEITFTIVNVGDAKYTWVVCGIRWGDRSLAITKYTGCQGSSRILPRVSYARGRMPIAYYGFTRETRCYRAGGARVDLLDWRHISLFALLRKLHKVLLFLPHFVL